VEGREAACRPGAGWPRLEQAQGSGPGCPEISTTFTVMGSTIIIFIMMMISFSLVLGIHSFIPSATVIIPTGTILTRIRRTVTVIPDMDMATDTVAPLTDPGMEPQAPQLQTFNAS